MNATARLDCFVPVATGLPGRTRPASTRNAPPRLAVMPFDDVAANERTASIADALTILVVGHLVCRDAVDLVSRASTMRYKGAHAALARIAREEGAGRIVQGAVLRHGGALQILVRLLDARTGDALLVRTYTGQAATIERMQAPIAWQIAEDLVVALRAA